MWFELGYHIVWYIHC